MKILSKTPIYLLFFSLCLVALLALSVIKMHAARVEERRNGLTNVVDMGVSTLRHFGALAYAGKLSKEEAQSQARAIIKSLHYGTSGYLTIIDFKGNVLMHPFLPELNGKNMLTFKDSQGTYLYKEIVATAVAPEHSGFVRYTWPRPGDQEPAPKISRVAGFPEWEWILVAGEYTDDLDLEIGNFLGK